MDDSSDTKLSGPCNTPVASGAARDNRPPKKDANGDYCRVRSLLTVHIAEKPVTTAKQYDCKALNNDDIDGT